MKIEEIEVEPIGICNLCGGSSAGRHVPIGDWNVSFCAECGLGRTDPRATPEALAKLYSQDYFAEHGWEEGPQGAEADKQVVGASKPLKLLHKHAPRGRLLEIGSGFGFFLEAARRDGYQAEGLEISEWAAEQSRKQFGLNVRTGAIDDFDPAGATYDVVALFHVLEHLPDPLGALRRIKGWLNPGGAILVEVPNCASDDAKGYGPDWKGWQPKYHLSHFTPETLNRTLKEAGFRGPVMQYGRSAYVRRRLKKVPVAGLFRCCVDRFYRGDWMRALATVPTER